MNCNESADEKTIYKNLKPEKSNQLGAKDHTPVTVVLTLPQDVLSIAFLFDKSYITVF